ALLAKALKTFRAIRITALEGCGQDAAVLLRSLFETTSAGGWGLQQDSRRRALFFAAHAHVRRLVAFEGRVKKRRLKRQDPKRTCERASCCRRMAGKPRRHRVGVGKAPLEWSRRARGDVAAHCWLA